MAVTVLPDGRYYADESADIEKFTDMIEQLLRSAWGSNWGIFTDESPTGDDPENASLPHITYNLASRVPMKDRTVKWAQFDSFPDPHHPGHHITLFKQWYDCEMEFAIYAKTRKETTRLAHRFEDFMNSYVGYFKYKGVQEIIFLEEEGPAIISMGRQDIPKRTLVYYVRIERISMVRSIDMKEITETVTTDSGETFDVDASDTSTSDTTSTTTQNLKASQSSEFSTKGSQDFLSIYNQHYPKKRS